MLFLTLSLLTLLGTHCQDTTTEVLSVRDPNNITIAYGSCINTFEESNDIHQTLQAVIQTQPDLWMWVGDAVYLDGQTFFLGSVPGPGYDVSNAEFVRDTYNSLKTHPTYTALRNDMSVIGTWDDHDYAYNDADETFPYKQRNMDIFLDFLDVPADSARRNQQGVYTSYYIGEDKLIKVILLDIRYNKDPQSTIGGLINSDDTQGFSDMLGEEQWGWLETELRDQTSAYTLIVTGLQFLPDDRPIVPNWFVDSKNRLFEMIRNSAKSGVVFISGDVHYAEILTYPCPARVGYNSLYELTSSGLTHFSQPADIVDGAFPNTYSQEEDRYFGKNFGLLRFVRQEGSTQPPNLLFEARDVNGNVVLSREIPHSDLVYDEAVANSYSGCPAAANSSIVDSVLPDSDDVSNAVDSVSNDVSSAVDTVSDNVSNAVDSVVPDI